MGTASPVGDELGSDAEPGADLDTGLGQRRDGRVTDDLARRFRAAGVDHRVDLVSVEDHVELGNCRQVLSVTAAMITFFPPMASRASRKGGQR
jgi:hypothetical protein